MTFDDSDDDARRFDAPLPPEDRLWRHPSELGGARPPGQPLPPPPAAPRTTRRGVWGVAVASAAIGAVLTAGVLLTVGVLRDDDPQVNERTVGPSEETDPAHVAEEAMPSIVRLEVSTPQGITAGSGVIFRDDGHVLTSADLLAGAQQVKAVLDNGESIDATIVGADPVSDVGVVRIDTPDPTEAVLGAAADLEPGEATIVITPPLTPGSGALVARAVIAEKGLRIDTGPESALHDMLRLQGALGDLPGGAVVLDQNGAVVAIATARNQTAVSTATSTTIATTLVAADEPENYATPIEYAHHVAGEIIELGHARHPWLGFTGVDASPTEDDPRSEKPAGVEIMNVEDGSPAAEAGLRPGDVIISLDGSRVERMTDFVVALRMDQPGDVAELEYLRGGEVAVAWPKVGELPA